MTRTVPSPVPGLYAPQPIAPTTRYVRRQWCHLGASDPDSVVARSEEGFEAVPHRFPERTS